LGARQALLNRAACALNTADRRSHAGVEGRQDVQAGTRQGLVAADLRLAELDAAGDQGAIAEIHDQSDAMGDLGVHI
jgi:hypothetical protein